MLKPALASVIFAMTGPSYHPLVEPPPAQYQRPPANIAGVLYADPRTVDAVCRELSPTPVPDTTVILACTVPSTGRMLMPDPCLFSDEFYAALLCHENGHLNGWKH